MRGPHLTPASTFAAFLGAVVAWLIIVLVGHILLDHVKYNSARAENRRLIQRTNRRMSMMYEELKKNKPPCELENFIIVPQEKEFYGN